jgi:hypothetical protein
MTHSKLVEIAAKYLQKKHLIVITEMKSWAIEIPDAIGFRIIKRVETTLIECKATRQDFFNDRKKPHRKNDNGMGTYKYYLVPKGLITVSDVPDLWGLLEVCEGVTQRVRQLKSAMPIISADGKNKETMLLISAMRRIGKSTKACDGISVNYYTSILKMG